MSLGPGTRHATTAPGARPLSRSSEVMAMDAQNMKTGMLRLVSRAAVIASGVGLGLGALLVAVAALFQ